MADEPRRACDGRRRTADLAVGNAEEDRLTAGDLASPGRAVDLVARGPECPGEGRAHPTGAHDPDAQGSRGERRRVRAGVGGDPFQFPHGDTGRSESTGPLPRGSGHDQEYPYPPPDNPPEPGLPFAQVSDLTPAERRQKLIELYHEVKACHACPLSATRTNPVFGMGNADADLMFVGEAPGAEEDRQGLPFVGRAGKLLDELLAGIGMTRKEHAFIANVLKSRPPGNRDPQPDEIESCRPYLERQVQLIEPRVICTLGNFATKLLTGSPTGITRVRGRPQERDVAGVPVVLYPLFHPAAALRTPAVLQQLRDDFSGIPELLEQERAAADLPGLATVGAPEPAAPPQLDLLA